MTILKKMKLANRKKDKKDKKVSKFLRTWHRHIGIFTAFFLIFLSLTGIALNHTDSFNLAKIHINNNFLLNHYGIKAANDVRYFPSFKHDEQIHQISITDNLVWIDDNLLTESPERVISVSAIKAMDDLNVIVVATAHQLSLFNIEGELLDKLGNESNLPHPIIGTGIYRGFYVIETQDKLYQTDKQFYEWNEITELNITPIKVEAVKAISSDENQLLLANKRFRGQFLTLERLIVDGHSGRIFGVIGVLIMDIVAILLIMLSISGVYIWLKKSKSKKKKRLKARR
jgi:hypothetical protein